MCFTLLSLTNSAVAVILAVFVIFEGVKNTVTIIAFKNKK
jgi:hypothetical protein